MNVENTVEVLAPVNPDKNVAEVILNVQTGEETGEADKAL